MADKKFDLVVIGSGPGGYVGAIRAAQLGLKTAVVEKDPTFGGTCLNVGCIPSKALLQSSENFAAANKEFSEHGIDLSGLKLNLPNMMKRKEKIVTDLTGGVKYLFDKNKIETFQGYGSFKDANTIVVTKDDGSTEEISTDKVMIATGSTPVELPHIKFDKDSIVDSTGALSFSDVPKRLCVIGGGVIGLELGSVWSRLGSQVTVVEFADKLIAGMDLQLSKDILRILKKQGIEFKLSSKVTGATVKGKNVEVSYEDMKKGGVQTFEVDKVLVAVGRRAYTDRLGLENVGIQTDDRGRIDVNEHLQTSQPHIFAVGDVIKGAMLAHKAEEEGVAVAEYLATGYGHVNYDTVPGVVYTWPEVASVGKTEQELKEAGIAYNSGMFPFSANGRAKAFGNTDGRVKVLADAKTDKLLGVHIIGPNASELIAEAVVAMEFGGSAEDLARSFHAHPTLAETMREAALAVDKRARQM
jgi:dihydrolipoamide dehydrogenase